MFVAETPIYTYHFSDRYARYMKKKPKPQSMDISLSGFILLPETKVTSTKIFTAPRLGRDVSFYSQVLNLYKHVTFTMVRVSVLIFMTCTDNTRTKKQFP
jgi:hypothetical protein